MTVPRATQKTNDFLNNRAAIGGLLKQPTGVSAPAAGNNSLEVRIQRSKDEIIWLAVATRGKETLGSNGYHTYTWAPDFVSPEDGSELWFYRVQARLFAPEGGMSVIYNNQELTVKKREV